jgi:altronate dehydratase large subunit
LKVTGNAKTYRAMEENFDFDASPVISDGKPIAELGENLFRQVLDVAEGKQTQAEKIGGHELFCIARRVGYHRPASSCDAG